MGTKYFELLLILVGVVNTWVLNILENVLEVIIQQRSDIRSLIHWLIGKLLEKGTDTISDVLNPI